MMPEPCHLHSSVEGAKVLRGGGQKIIYEFRLLTKGPNMILAEKVEPIPKIEEVQQGLRGPCSDPVFTGQELVEGDSGKFARLEEWQGEGSAVGGEFEKTVVNGRWLLMPLELVRGKLPELKATGFVEQKELLRTGKKEFTDRLARVEAPGSLQSPRSNGDQIAVSCLKDAQDLGRLRRKPIAPVIEFVTDFPERFSRMGINPLPAAAVICDLGFKDQDLLSLLNRLLS